MYRSGAHEEPTFQTYTEVAQAVGTGHRNLGNPLYYLKDRCHEREWPTYTVFVGCKVGNRRGLPARGCDVMTREEVDAEIARIRAVDWPLEPWW